MPLPGVTHGVVSKFRLGEIILSFELQCQVKFTTYNIVQCTAVWTEPREDPAVGLRNGSQNGLKYLAEQRKTCSCQNSVVKDFEKQKNPEVHRQKRAAAAR